MNAFEWMGVLCWVGSVVLLLWIVVDFFRTNITYDERYLLSSLEGHDEIAEQERRHQEEREARA